MIIDFVNTAGLIKYLFRYSSAALGGQVRLRGVRLLARSVCAATRRRSQADHLSLLPGQGTLRAERRECQLLFPSSFAFPSLVTIFAHQVLKIIVSLYSSTPHNIAFIFQTIYQNYQRITIQESPNKVRKALLNLILMGGYVHFSSE